MHILSPATINNHSLAVARRHEQSRGNFLGFLLCATCPTVVHKHLAAKNWNGVKDRRLGGHLLRSPVDRDALLLSPLVEHSKVSPFISGCWEPVGPMAVHEAYGHLLCRERHDYGDNDEDQDVEGKSKASAEEGGEGEQVLPIGRRVYT